MFYHGWNTEYWISKELATEKSLRNEQPGNGLYKRWRKKEKRRIRGTLTTYKSKERNKT